MRDRRWWEIGTHEYEDRWWVHAYYWTIYAPARWWILWRNRKPPRLP